MYGRRERHAAVLNRGQEKSVGIAAGEEKIFLVYRGDKGKIRYSEGDTFHYTSKRRKVGPLSRIGLYHPDLRGVSPDTLSRSFLTEEGGSMPKGKNTILKKIYFEPDEWKEVERRAVLLGKRATAYVKEMAVHGVVKCYDFTEYQKLAYPLRGIGVNINQIATVVNSTGSIFEKDIVEIRTQLAKLKELFDEYFKELKYTNI